MRRHRTIVFDSPDWVLVALSLVLLLAGTAIAASQPSAPLEPDRAEPTANSDAAPPPRPAP